MNSLTLTAVLGGAVADSWNPCAIGVLLLLIAFIVSARHARRYVIIFGLAYVLGVYITYFSIGLGFLKAIHLFGLHNFFGWLTAFLLIVFGLGHLNPLWAAKIPGLRWLMTCKVPSNYRAQAERGAVIGGLILGALVGICEFPCSGAVYLAIVGLLAKTVTFWQGVGYLALYNLIFILPLVVILVVVGRPKVLERIENWQHRHVLQASRILGLIMLISGIGLLLWLMNP
ncbi:hypothetical protein HYW32_02035 [Candidatus Berkelbacteria bacterium]|nr:hypothetical protein [Candidatus Berkelbacteria bacterium]